MNKAQFLREFNKLRPSYNATGVRYSKKMGKAGHYIFYVITASGEKQIASSTQRNPDLNKFFEDIISTLKAMKNAKDVGELK